MKKNFKRFLFSGAAALVCALALTAAVSAQRMQRRFDVDLYQNVIRLHVIANSDSAADQAAKLAVRDEIVSYLSDLTADADDARAAEKILTAHLDDIRARARLAAEDAGCPYHVDAVFSEERYPVRYYDGFAFPAGTYRSLRIVLGAGEGKNWWCVLYPAVCVSMSSEVPSLLADAGVGEKTVEIVCGKRKNYKLGMYLLEWFDRLTG